MTRARAIAAIALGSAIACSDSTGPATSTGVTFNICSAFAKGWVAYQNDGGPWTRVTPNASGQVMFNPTPRVSLAMARQIGTTSLTRVVNAQSSELQAAMSAACDSDRGTHFITGGILGVTGSEYVRIAGGPSVDFASVSDPSWRLEDLTSSPVDLMATRYASASAQPANRVFVRRSVLAADKAIADIDFAGSESAALESAVATFGGVGANASIFLTTSVTTAGHVNHTLGDVLVSPAPPSISYVSLPASLRVATDLHLLSAGALNAEGTRTILSYYRAPESRLFTFGPMVPVPTLSLVAQTPYKRPQAVIASQTEYPSVMLVEFSESPTPTTSRVFTVLSTAGFFGGTPSPWTITFPDLTAGGYDPNFGFHSSLFHWSVTAYSGDPIVILGGSATDGVIVSNATRAGDAQVATGASTAKRAP